MGAAMRVGNNRAVVGGMVLLGSVLFFVITLSLTGQGSPLSLGNTPSDSYEHFVHPLNSSSGYWEVFLNGTSGLTWDPDVVSIPTQAPVVFVVGVIGYTPHNFTLDSISNDTTLSPNWTPQQVDSYFVKYPPLARIVPEISAGSPQSTPPVQLPTHAVLTFICEVPGHFQQGMFGHVYIGVPAPSSPASTFGLNKLQLDALGISTAGVLIVAVIFVARSHKPPRVSPDEEEEEPASSAVPSVAPGEKPPQTW